MNKKRYLNNEEYIIDIATIGGMRVLAANLKNDIYKQRK